MIIVVQGTNSFNNYTVFMRAMAVAMSSNKNNDNDFYIFSENKFTDPKSFQV